MQVREAVAIAKNYLKELYADEQIAELGLEEVEFDDSDGAWSVTLGFTRPWDSPRVMAAFESPRRTYKVVRLLDRDGEVISVKNREPVMA